MGDGTSTAVPYLAASHAPELLADCGLLLLAIVLGGAVGWQREVSDQPAGFRTHILVTVGSALVTLVSQSYARDVPARMAANVVVGVGFLGAGAIMRHESSVRGLTTAASLWVSACIGIAVGHGGGTVVLAIVCTALVLTVLTLFSNVERRWIHGKHRRSLAVVYDGQIAHRQAILSFLAVRACELLGVNRDEQQRTPPSTIVLYVQIPSGIDFLEMTDTLMAEDWVQSVTWT